MCACRSVSFATHSKHIWQNIKRNEQIMFENQQINEICRTDFTQPSVWDWKAEAIYVNWPCHWLELQIVWSTTFHLTFFSELVNSSMQFSWSQWRAIFLRSPMKNVANNNEINEQLDTQQQQQPKQKKMNAKRMKRKNSHIFSVFALEHVIYCKQEPWQHFFPSAHSTFLYHRKRAVMKTMYAVGLWLVKCKSHW